MTAACTLYFHLQHLPIIPANSSCVVQIQAYFGHNDSADVPRAPLIYQKNADLQRAECHIPLQW